MRLPRGTAIGVFWIVTVVLAFALGWLAGGWRTTAETDTGPTIAVIRPPDVLPPPTLDRTPIPRSEAPGPAPEPAPPREPVDRSASPVDASETPDAQVEDPAPSAPEVAVPEPDPTPSPVEVAPLAPPPIDTTERVLRADRLAGEGDLDGARAEAEAVLAEHGTYSALEEALVEDGTETIRARLLALRTVQLAGMDAIAVDLARELKRSYAGTPAVLDAVRRWDVLKPRILALESALEDGDGIRVEGTIDNPDVGSVRRVFVLVEALDAAGNVIAETRARVRPRKLEPQEIGSFDVRFDEPDPATILRTRATVVEWESEVFAPE